jgi:hypothetical protein
MRAVGYEFLRTSLDLKAPEILKPARIGLVARIVDNGNHLAIPQGVAPADDGPLTHLLFALKHEEINLCVIAQAVKHIPADHLLAELKIAPNGQYIRCASYLWEQYRQERLPYDRSVGGTVIDLFDPKKYVTGLRVRNARWRVSFNGLGSPQFCATVRRTEAISKGLEAQILERSKEFVASLDADMMDRALTWAYLHETKDSFAIEREVPTEDKARTFVKLLRQAHDERSVTEDYLVELQSSTVANPFDRAVQFRVDQNWLANGMRGAAGVTYVPPPPDALAPLMDEWMAMANSLPGHVDPIVSASVISFSFVYLHPFMDGNGRLSRFMFHKALCASGALDKGLLLPVSAAIKRNEAEYLKTLQVFSRPAREQVSVLWVQDGQFDFTFKTGDDLWRYWDATAQVEFGFKMAEQALNIDLRKETQYLVDHDAIVRVVNEAYDLRSSDLATLVSICIDGNGHVSNTKRKTYGDRVSNAALDFIETTTQAVLTRLQAMPVSTEQDTIDKGPRKGR